MSDSLQIRDQCRVNVDRKRPTDDKIGMEGIFDIEHFRAGKCIRKFREHNLITIEGKNYNLDSTFRGVTQSSTWYLSLIDNAGYSAIADTDTYVNINQAGNGWDEFEAYEYAANGLKRVPWVESAASGGSISNSASVGVFDIVAPGGTVKGVFLCGQPDGGAAAPEDQGDNAAAGKLWNVTLFSTGDVVVINGDQLKITYTINS